MNELQSILLGDMPLLISADGYRRLMVSAFPLATPTSFFIESKTYEQKSREEFDKLLQSLRKQLTRVSADANIPEVTLTMDYDSPELPDGSVAYHRLWGIVTAESRYYFSTKQLERDLLAAEQNPQITSHLLHVKSPGGEAYYLDRLSETMQQLEKPVVVLYEMACSAAYHIACHGRRVYATTAFDFVGCIGTMVSFYDFQAYYDKLGIRLIEAKADGSDLKNKKFDDLRQGKPQQYIDEVLNPLNDRLLQTVKAQRPQLAKLDDDAPVLRGETYFTRTAEEIGLCDGQRTLAEAVMECAGLGRKWSDSQQKKQQLYNVL